MFRHWITSIDYEKLIELQSKGCNVRLNHGERINEIKNDKRTSKAKIKKKSYKSK